MACCQQPPPLKKYRDFRPNLKKMIGAPKFYARHETKKTEPQDRINFYADVIQKKIDYDERDHYMKPRYSNQEYGWHRNPKLIHLQSCDLKLSSHPCITGVAKKIYNYRDYAVIDPKKYCLCKDTFNDHWKIV